MSEPPALTYCGNVHPATDVSSWLDLTERFALPIARERTASGHAFGLGTWWNAATAAQLVNDENELRRVRDFLAHHGLSIWTLNIFPHGSFHGAAVKERVYRPDWSSEERVTYTLHAASLAARLGESNSVVPMSTLPLGYGDVDRDACGVQFARVAAALAALRQEHGVHVILAIEPEPFCALETVAATAAFLEQVFQAGSRTGADEAVLRDHLGVCIDLCHLAVVGEDPVSAWADLRARGIRCPKIQVSSCLELRDGAALDELLAFDEPVYLHQSVAADGTRAIDLPEVRRRSSEFVDAGTIRTHFHLPVFWDQAGAALGSTRDAMLQALRGLSPPLPLLEVETYTWGVLPGYDRSDEGLRSGILDELRFVTNALKS